MAIRIGLLKIVMMKRWTLAENEQFHIALTGEADEFDIAFQCPRTAGEVDHLVED